MMRFIPLLFILLLGGCSGSKYPSVSREQADAPQASDFTDDARRWSDSVAASLSLEQQIAQMMLPGIYANGDSLTIRKIADYCALGTGGVVLLKGDCLGAAEISRAFSGKSQVPPFIAIDAEWGLGMRLADAPLMPRNGSVSALCSDQVMYDYGYEIARESRALGVNMVLGPVLDVASGGVIGSRSFGADPERVAALGVAYARGLEDGNVISVAKHFPGHGSARTDSHKSLPLLECSLARLDSIDLLPFREYINGNLSAVMVGHLAVSALDPESRSAALSPVVISDLLRRDMGFGGLVVTDALNMGGAVSEENSDVAAVMAGADLIIAPRDTRKAIIEIAEAVRSGKIEASRILESCRRILFYKYRFGLGSDDSGDDTAKRIDPTIAEKIRIRLLRGS